MRSLLCNSQSWHPIAYKKLFKKLLDHEIFFQYEGQRVPSPITAFLSNKMTTSSRNYHNDRHPASIQHQQSQPTMERPYQLDDSTTTIINLSGDAKPSTNPLMLSDANCVTRLVMLRRFATLGLTITLRLKQTTSTVLKNLTIYGSLTPVYRIT